MAKAIEQRWPISEEYRKAIISRMVRIAVDSKSSNREATAAAKAVMAAELQNQADEHKVIDVRVQTRHDELAGIAADLGIEVGAIEDATQQTDCGISGTQIQSNAEVERR
tara:strand:+ start:1473 stop:1802 length:330 start_codon:yes stop_codon:yes gene_type:complete